MGRCIEFTSENFATAKEGVVLVDSWAPWCGPCRMLSPAIGELASDLEDKTKICKANTDEQGDLAAEYSVRSIPTSTFFKNGEAAGQLVGAQSKQAIVDKINSLLQYSWGFAPHFLH